MVPMQAVPCVVRALDNQTHMAVELLTVTNEPSLRFGEELRMKPLFSILESLRAICGLSYGSSVIRKLQSSY